MNTDEPQICPECGALKMKEDGLVLPNKAGLGLGIYFSCGAIWWLGGRKWAVSCPELGKRPRIPDSLEDFLQAEPVATQENHLHPNSTSFTASHGKVGKPSAG